MTHASISPSAASRWMNCPGSVALCATLPKRTSAYADEGSAAHALAEKYLTNGIISVATTVGQWLVQDGRDWWLEKAKPKSGTAFPVTKEMAEAVQVYTDHIDSIESDHKKFELKLDLKWLHSGIYGTTDCLILDGEVVHVIDYKHGAGVAVEVDENPQMMIYGLMAVGKDVLKSDVKTLRLTIVQPRKPHPDGLVRSWDIDVKDLMDWAENVLLPAAQATELEGAPLVPGPKQCKWCEASRQGKCPAILGQVQETTGLALVSPIIEAPKLPNPKSLTVTDKARLLSMFPAVRAWMDIMETDAEEMAKQGTAIPGHKLVHKITRRRYRDEAQAAATLKPLLGDEIWETKLKSPSQLEKLGGKAAKDLLAQLTESPVGELTLVPESDRRRAVDPNAALEMLLEDL